MKKKCPQMRFFMKGFLEMFILSETSKRPTSGKEIMDSMRDITGDGWNLSPGATYPVLRKMEKEGLVAAKLALGEGRRKILYESTAKGRKKLVAFRIHLIDKFGNIFRLFLPLTIHVTHDDLDEGTQKKILELSTLFMENRASLLRAPPGKLASEVDKMLAAVKRIKKRREGR
ncbi:MAG: PadR family transcriptional regulator [Candidatus Micrarchaeota archaeon]